MNIKLTFMDKNNFTVLIFLMLCVFLLPICGHAQQLVNGDLEGDININDPSLPDFWEQVPFSDINCEASNSNTSTADLTSTDAPAPNLGVIGTPFSGNTFISGGHASINDGTIYHEGIMQLVSGFTIGQEYTLSFYQTIVKSSFCRDTSGSWAIILDDSILEISVPSKSALDYDDVNLGWEYIEVSFIANQSDSYIKFLPWDDDDTLLCYSGDESGGLVMGIDNIELSMTTPIEEVLEVKKLAYISPNPISDFLKITLDNFENETIIAILDYTGKIVMNKTFSSASIIEMKFPYPDGIYFLIVRDKSDSIVKKFIKQ